MSWKILENAGCARQLCFPKSTISPLPRFHPAAAAVGLVRCSSGQWAFIWYAARPPTAGALCVRRQRDTLMSPLIRAWKLDGNQTLISRGTCIYTHVPRGAANSPATEPASLLAPLLTNASFGRFLLFRARGSASTSKSLGETQEETGLVFKIKIPRLTNVITFVYVILCTRVERKCFLCEP